MTPNDRLTADPNADIHEAMRCLTALYIAVDESVATHVMGVVRPLLEQLRAARAAALAPADVEALRWLCGFVETSLNFTAGQSAAATAHMRRALSVLRRLCGSKP